MFADRNLGINLGGNLSSNFNVLEMFGIRYCKWQLRQQMKNRVFHLASMNRENDLSLASFDGNFFPDLPCLRTLKSNGQRGKKRGVTPFSSSSPLAREYDKEISRLARLPPV